jgi:SOS-response transcriptional repressor LexA
MSYTAAMTTRSERLKKARRDAGYRTARDAAAALAVGYSTYAGHENGSRQFEIDAAIVYARKFKVPVEYLLTGKINPVPSVEKTPLATIPVIGIVRAGTWQDVDAGDSGMFQVVPAAPGEPAEWQYAFTVEGNSLNRIAKSGSILVCLDFIKSRVEIQDSDLVIVERSRFGGQMVERTGKRVRKTTSGFELWPDSDDPAHQEPILLDGHDGADEVRVVAKVLWIMSKP